MGATLNKINWIPRDGNWNTKDIHLLSQNEVDLEFNRLYSVSREMLYSITNAPREQLLENAVHCLRRQSKSLADCFNQMGADRSGSMGMVYTGPSSHPVGPNNVIRCESRKLPPHGIDTVCPKANSDSQEVAADVIKTMLSMGFLE